MHYRGAFDFRGFREEWVPNKVSLTLIETQISFHFFYIIEVFRV